MSEDAKFRKATVMDLINRTLVEKVVPDEQDALGRPIRVPFERLDDRCCVCAGAEKNGAYGQTSQGRVVCGACLDACAKLLRFAADPGLLSERALAGNGITMMVQIPWPR